MIQNVHSYSIPAVTGGNMSQRVMTSHWRLPFNTCDTLAQPILHIIRHTRPIKTICQSCERPRPSQMSSKQRCMIRQEKLFSASLRNQQLQLSALGTSLPPQRAVIVDGQIIPVMPKRPQLRKHALHFRPSRKFLCQHPIMQRHTHRVLSL